MKKKLIYLLMVALLATATQAVDISSLFVNIDFDSGAVTTGGPGFKGFDAPSATEIIGWTNYRNSTSGPLNDAGVEAADVGWWIGGYGYQNAAFMSSNDAAYTTSTYIIQPGDVFNIKYIGARWAWTGTGQWTATLFYNTPANVIGTYVQNINSDWLGQNVWYSSPTVIAATPASIGGTLGILVKSTGTGTSQIDEITIETVPTANISPANGATLIPVELTNAANDLVFTVYDPNITKADILFGTENDPNLTTKPAYKIVNKMAVTTGQYTVNLETLAADLAFNTTYYWKVVGYEPNAIPGGNDIAFPGSVWNFTTVPATPVFTVNPGNAGAFENGSTSLTATVTSVTAFAPANAIRWYKEAGETDVEITTGITETRNPGDTQATSVLVISSLTPAEEGVYYATATNTGGTTTSTNGTTVIKKLLAQYLFDDNLNDNSGNGLNGTGLTPSGAALDPNYLTGIAPATGKAAVFNGLGDSNITNTTGNYVDLPDGFSNLSQGITITAWVYPTAIRNWARIVELGNGTDGASNSLYFTRVAEGSTLRFENDNLNSPASSITTGDNAITLNEWQLLVLTLNTDATNNAVIYRNGIAAATGTVSLPNVITRTNCFIGRSEWYGDSLYNGQMDDVRIYNYGLTAPEVGDLYVAVNGPFCQVKPIYDFDDNCEVDLGDFAIFAATWLECGVYPNCN